MEYKIEIREIEPLCVAYMSYEEMLQKQTGYFLRCFNQYTGKQTGHRFSTICL